MDVKRPKLVSLWAILLILLTPATSKILPSLLAKFTAPDEKQRELATGSISHLSRNFRDQDRPVHHEPIKISSSLVSTPKDQIPQERGLGAAENYAAFDVNFETTEIKDVLSFIEYKMNEITALVQECIDQEYAEDVGASIEVIRHECVGSTYQIIFFNYNEGIKKIKEVLMEILKLKLQNLKEDYEDETNFFLDILESLVNKDYTIPKSLELAKKASKYYVSPRYFDRLVQLTNPEVQAFTVLHDRLKEQRSKIQDQLRTKQQNEEEYMDAIERKARMLRKRNESARQMRDVRKEQERNRQLSGNRIPFRLQRQSLAAANPADAQDSKYLDQVSSQLDSLGLYHNPALPAEEQESEPSIPFMMPQPPNQDDLMV